MHITEKEKESFKNSSMTTEETIIFLEHLNNCNFCLNELMQSEENSPLPPAPSYLKEQILKTAASPEIQAARAVKKTSHKMQMFYYSLRTAAGIIMALFLLFTIDQVDFAALNPSQFLQTESREDPPKPIRGNYLADFSRRIHTELSEGTEQIADYFNNIFK